MSFIAGYLLGLGEGGGANIQPLTVTENKEYNASDYGCDGFNPVVVNVPAGGSDPRIEAIENARELARAVFANGWTLRAKFSDDNSVNLTYANPINSSGHPYQYKSGLSIWGCYYKNDEFMFAVSGSYFAVSNLGDYYLNYEKNELYKSSDEIYTITDVNSFEIFESSFPPNATISIKFNVKSTYHSYDYDGNVTSEYESISEGYSAGTPRLSELEYSGYCKVISRGDWQTYLNDMVDFRMNSIGT